MEHLMTILVALIGGGAVSLVQFLIQRKDAKDDKFKGIMEKIDGLDAKVDEGFEQVNQRMTRMEDANELQWVGNSRSHILRFDDELRVKQKHSLEYFDEILQCIDKYEDYAREHPDYPNSKAVSAIEHIRKVYRECKDENSFI